MVGSKDTAQLLSSTWTFQLTGVVFVNILQPRLGIKCLRGIEVDILQLRPGLKYLRPLKGGTIKKEAPSSITGPRALSYNNRRSKMTIWAVLSPGQWFPLPLPVATRGAASRSFEGEGDNRGEIDKQPSPY